jgi:hypothetical protein
MAMWVVVEQHELAPPGMAWTVLRDPEGNLPERFGHHHRRPRSANTDNAASRLADSGGGSNTPARAGCSLV